MHKSKKKFIIVFILVGLYGCITKIMLYRKFRITESLSDKHLALYLMMNQWVRNKQKGKKIDLYFKKYGYRRIAIYGMSYAGETLLAELQDTEIEVICVIDKNKINTNVQVVTVEEIPDIVDVIVVTAITYFDEIENKLSKIVGCPVVSLEDILCTL